MKIFLTILFFGVIIKDIQTVTVKLPDETSLTWMTKIGKAVALKVISQGRQAIFAGGQILDNSQPKIQFNEREIEEFSFDTRKLDEAYEAFVKENEKDGAEPKTEAKIESNFKNSATFAPWTNNYSFKGTTKAPLETSTIEESTTLRKN